MNAIMLDDLACFLDNMYIYIFIFIIIYIYIYLYDSISYLGYTHILTKLRKPRPSSKSGRGLAVCADGSGWLCSTQHTSRGPKRMGQGGMFICKDVDFARKK